MKKYLTLLLAIVVFACNNDEIDDLKKRVDDLDTKIAEQQAALDAAVADLKSQITTINTDLTSQNESLNGIVADLNQLQDDLTSEATKVYWGNLVSDADFTEFTDGGYRVVSGYVAVSSNSHLTALSELEVVGGFVEIKNVSDAIELAQLQIVGSGVEITKTTSTSANFPLLASTGADVDVYDNVNLASVSMPELAYVDDELYIENYNYGTNTSSALASIDMSKLAAVNNDITVIYFNGTDISFPELIYVGRNLIIEQNSKMETINFDKLETIDGSLMFNYNATGGGVGIGFGGDATGFTSFDDFNALTSVKGNVELYGNNAMESLIGFSALETTGNITVSSANALYVFDAFNAVTKANDIRLTGMGKSDGTTYTINGFNTIDTLDGALTITSNKSMAAINAFENLVFINNVLDISSNDQHLLDINGFNKLEWVQGINIQWNLDQNTGATGLEDISGFNALKEVSWQGITIANNWTVTDLTGFSALESIATSGSLSITDNQALTTISAFGNLVSTGTLTITGNSALASMNFGSLVSLDRYSMHTVHTYNAGTCDFKTIIDDLEAGNTDFCCGGGFELMDETSTTYSYAVGDLASAVAACP